jgi:hypothetical protein
VREYQQRMKEKHGRPGEGDKPEQLGDGVTKMGGTYRNKDGMTSDAKGNVQQQWVWTRAAIIDYLSEAGLDKLFAEDLAKQFVQPDGTVAYTASDAQKKWGGQYATLAEALGKMADYYKFDSTGKHQASERTAFLNGPGTPPAPAPAPAPGPAPGPGGHGNNNSQFGRQYVTLNINLNDRPYGSVNTDSDGARTLQGLLQELERSKRNGGY